MKEIGPAPHIGRIGDEGGQTVALSNPFRDALALENSNYCMFERGHLLHPHSHEPASDLTVFVHDGLRALMLNERFTCVGAKAAFRQGAYRFGLYGELASAPASAGLARDLFTFVVERRSIKSDFTTFIASFFSPTPGDETTFERLLWSALQQVHDLDAYYHRWDAAVSADTTDPRFAFSFAGMAFFIVGLHAASSRASRRFAWPTLVFNPHDQFEQLRETGQFPRFQEVIRRGEVILQGNINPMLADYGDRSEASQYSGRTVESDWRCPFHTQARNTADQGNNRRVAHALSKESSQQCDDEAPG